MLDKFVFGIVLILCIGISVAMFVNAMTADDDPHARWE